jgi:hypothetical protein
MPESSQRSILGEEPEKPWTSPEQLPSIASSRQAVELAKYNLRQAVEALRAAEKALQDAEQISALAHGLVDTPERKEPPAHVAHEQPPRKP